MTDLKAKKRDAGVKGKKLRREGFIPAVLYGKHMDESSHLQVTLKDAVQFLKYNSVGSRVELIVGKKKQMALLKEITYTPVSNAIEHLSFQALTAGEKVTSSAHIVILNKDSVEGVIQQSLSEISFKALPKDLFDRVEINLEGMGIGDSISVSDLEVFKNEAIEILDNPDDSVLSITEAKEYVEETDEDEDSEETEAPEVPLVDEEEKED